MAIFIKYKETLNIFINNSDSKFLDQLESIDKRSKMRSSLQVVQKDH